MKNKDKTILTSSALETADTIISGITPLNIAWALCKGLFGANFKLRQKRILEWAESIRDNPSIFTKEIMADEAFQDGFVYLFEQYIRERNEKKRKYIKNIFIEFTKNGDKDNNPIERLIHVISQLIPQDIEVLKELDVNKKSTYHIYGNTVKNVTSIYHLIYLGILLTGAGARIGPMYAPMISITDFGRDLIQYINDEGGN